MKIVTFAVRPALVALFVLLAACAAPGTPTATQLPAATLTLPAPTATEAAPVEPTAAPTTQVSPSEQPATEAPATVPPATEVPELLAQPILQEFDVPPGTRPHDVAPAVDGGVWYTAQAVGALGYLDPATGATEHIPLGTGSAPHGVIIGPDGAPWITDSGLNAIGRVDPETRVVETFPLPATAARANLNTAAFDGNGVL